MMKVRITTSHDSDHHNWIMTVRNWSSQQWIITMTAIDHHNEISMTAIDHHNESWQWITHEAWQWESFEWRWYDNRWGRLMNDDYNWMMMAIDESQLNDDDLWWWITCALIITRVQSSLCLNLIITILIMSHQCDPKLKYLIKMANYKSLQRIHSTWMSWEAMRYAASMKQWSRESLISAPMPWPQPQICRLHASWLEYWGFIWLHRLMFNAFTHCVLVQTSHWRIWYLGHSGAEFLGTQQTFCT